MGDDRGNWLRIDTRVEGNKGRKFRNYLATSSREYARGMECSTARRGGGGGGTQTDTEITARKLGQRASGRLRKLGAHTMLRNFITVTRVSPA